MEILIFYVKKNQNHGFILINYIYNTWIVTVHLKKAKLQKTTTPK
jgi:hypothetical protein